MLLAAVLLPSPCDAVPHLAVCVLLRYCRIEPYHGRQQGAKEDVNQLLPLSHTCMFSLVSRQSGLAHSVVSLLFLPCSSVCSC